MKYPLNPQQAKAVAEFDADLLVTAGAGTGKTSVLTNKYLRLIEERRAGVSEIVAITFTKKAAAEMRSRIQQEIQEHLNEAATPVEKEFWKTQLGKMESARITTFHSFCLGLLHEHPLEIGISPVTSIQGEGEETIYLNQAIEKVLLESFRELSADNERLTRLTLDFGWDSFINSLADAYRQVRESGKTFIEVMQSSTAYLQESLRQTPYQFEHLNDEVIDFLNFCQTVSLTEKAEEIVSSLREEWPNQQTIMSNHPTDDTVLSMMAKLKRGLPKTVPNVIKDRVIAIHELIELLSRKLLDQESLLRINIIGQLLNRIDAAYTMVKKDLGSLDFTDQLRLVRDLLSNQPRILLQTRQEISYLLVDEFQDTNSLQLEIVDLLVGTGHSQGRLMAVGDIKQSIYRFRGAEADLIEGLARRLRENQGKIIPLTQNYRSNPSIIRFVNEFFGQLFEGEIFPYEPLEAATVDQNVNIEFLLTGSLDRQAEAQMVAQRIKQLISEPGAPFHYGDIVILFRASTAMPLYQQALQKIGIPYYTASGGGFYRRPEVVDQLNLLRLVEQCYHGVALLGLLTSPYVGLSAESLLWLGEGQDLVEQFYKQETFSEHISPAEQLRLEKFREVIVYLQKNREHLGIPTIIRTALLGSNYREILWALPHAGQRLANLDKLLEKADEFTSKGFYDLHRFLEFIEKLEEVAVVEGEAQTQAETSDVVRLMTIHRAKGLEFPIVFLPDLDRQFPKSCQGRLAFHRSAGIGLTIRFGDAENGASSLWEKIKDLDKQEELSEVKRVLYVALTRAKQQLILSGSGCNKAKGKKIETANNWMKWFELLIPMEKAGPILDYRGITLNITRELPETKNVIPGATFLAENISVLPARIEINADSEKEIAVTRLMSKTAIKTFKVTELLAFKECARRYFWEYRWGLKESMVTVKQPTAEGRGLGVNSGAKIGNFLHQVIQSAGTQWPDKLWQETFQDMPVGLQGKLKTDLIQMWQNYRRSDFTEEHGRCWDEVPFLIKLADDQRVEGRFDRLIQAKNGVLTLVDYKSHRITGSEVAVKAKTYFWQLQLYALAIEALWGRLPDQAVLYFLYPNEIVAVPLDQESLAKTRQDVRNIMRFIEEYDKWQEYAQGERCEYCEFRSVCGRG
jgi:ATP-dependent helicase/nuclease subunit A